MGVCSLEIYYSLGTNVCLKITPRTEIGCTLETASCLGTMSCLETDWCLRTHGVSGHVVTISFSFPFSPLPVLPQSYISKPPSPCKTLVSLLLYNIWMHNHQPGLAIHNLGSLLSQALLSQFGLSNDPGGSYQARREDRYVQTSLINFSYLWLGTIGATDG